MIAGVRPQEAVAERRDDGTLLVQSPTPLGPYPRTIIDSLRRWAADAPHRTFIARRDGTGAWRCLTFADTWARVRAVAQALLDRDLPSDSTIVIVSGNGLEHQILALAAMTCGIPYAPIAPAYSLTLRDHGALSSLIGRMRPCIVFADDGARYEPALTKVLAPDIELVTVTPGPTLASTRYSSLEETEPTPAVDTAQAAVTSDTIAKVLFTSGSTGRPKGVINTHRMLCANLEQIRTALPLLADAPPVICDWLPWNHTFGGNHNVGIALYNGGSLYIDDGRPVPGAFETTVSNLKDVAPTAYFNVPKGYEMLLPYLRGDEVFRKHFFGRLRLMFYAAAGIRPETAEAFQQMAVETTGHTVPWVTGLGATESGPSAMFTGPLLSPVAEIGVPVAGLVLKAAPEGDRYEARVKGPNVTPGYWRDEALTSASFDDEGFYKLGDAILPVDPSNLAKGFTFQGRLNEDFKLSTGTWVRVGMLRARLLAVAGDLISDVVVAAPGRERIAALLFPNLAACRTVAAMGNGAPLAEVVAHPRVREAIEARLHAFNAGDSGSSTSFSKAVVLDVPPSADALEITDKGSINQKAVLAHRATLVDTLYASTSSTLLI